MIRLNNAQVEEIIEKALTTAGVEDPAIHEKIVTETIKEYQAYMQRFENSFGCLDAKFKKSTDNDDTIQIILEAPSNIQNIIMLKMMDKGTLQLLGRQLNMAQMAEVKSMLQNKGDDDALAGQMTLVKP